MLQWPPDNHNKASSRRLNYVFHFGSSESRLMRRKTVAYQQQFQHHARFLKHYRIKLNETTDVRMDGRNVRPYKTGVIYETVRTARMYG